MNRKCVSKLRYTTYESVIADRRIELGFSQEELAAKLGVERTSVTNIEAGRQFPRIENLRKLARALKWDVDQLLKALGV